MTSNNTDYFDLIPDYHHGLLDPETRSRFEQELGTNKELREELEEFGEIRTFYSETDSAAPEPSEAMFRKITAAIDAIEKPLSTKQEKVRLPLPVTTTDALSVWNRLKDFVTVPWGLAFIQAVVIIVLLVPGTPEKIYTTLSLSPKTATEQSGTLFNIVFKDSAREAEIRELLLAVNGIITSGPSPEGRYVVALSRSAAGDRSVEQLRQSTIVVFLEKAY